MMTIGSNTNPSTCENWPYRVTIADYFPLSRVLEVVIWLEHQYPDGCDRSGDHNLHAMYRHVGNGWILKDHDVAVELVFRYGN